MSELEIPDGWILKKIGEKSLIETNKGRKPTNLSEIQEKDYLPYLDIQAFEKNIFKYFASKNDGTLCTPEDVLIVWDGSRSGLVGFSQHGLVGSTIMKLQIKDKIIPKYFYYFLKSKYNILNSNPRGGAIPHVNPDIFFNLDILFPEDKKIQEKIVQKLDDVLGQLNKKKIKILSLIEQNKTRIDFFEKNWISYVIENEIKKYSQRKECRIMTLGETFNESNQKWLPFKKSEIVNYVGLENIESNTGILINFTPTESSKIKSSKTVFTKNDVLYGKLRPYLNKVLIPTFEGICSTDILVLHPKSNILREFLAYFLRSWYVLSHVNKSTHGTKMPRTKIQVLQAISIRLPDTKIQKEIVQNIKNAEEKFHKQKIQFENIKQNYESQIKYMDFIQLAILNFAFSGKLLH